MKKRDINLLESVAMTKVKKNSSSTVALMAVAVLVLVGMMVYLFASAKLEIAKYDDMLKDLEQQLGRENELIQKEQEYEQLKNEYYNQVNQVISIIAPNISAGDRVKIASGFMKILDTYRASHQTAGEDDIKITAITMSEDTITLTCASKNHVDAWDFADFMAGNEVAGEDEQTLAQTILNRELFDDVELNFPGLPAEPGEEEAGEGEATDTETYPINFVLTFNIHWEELI